MREKLTATKVRTLPPGMYGDGNGLWLRVVTAERRAWLFRAKPIGVEMPGYRRFFKGF